MLIINNLTKFYKKKKVLNNLNFRLSENAFEALIGRSGSGKSTLLSILVGLSNPNSGSIKVFNNLIDKKNKQIMENLGYAPQEPLFDPNQTLTETLKTTCALWGMSSLLTEKKIRELTCLFQMREFAETKTQNLSGGNKKILSLIKAVIFEPKFLILDEPTTGLDSQKKQLIWGYLKSYHQSGHTILLVSHNWEEVQKLCDAYSILEKGEFIKKESIISTKKDALKVFQIKLSHPLNENFNMNSPYLCNCINSHQIEFHLEKTQKISDAISFLEQLGASVASIESKETEPLEYLSNR